MSTLELIYEKSKTLPDRLQSEALSFVEYLSRRRAATSEAEQWQSQAQKTRKLPAVQRLTDQDIAAEIAAYRANR